VVTRPRDCSWVTGKFENLAPQNFKCSSDPDDDYNCIAWAAGKTDNYWWPTTLWPFYWPKGLPTFPDMPNDIAESVDNFIAAFEREGYRVCKDGGFHPNYEKIAIYANKLGRVKHAARLLTTGVWSSKLGEHEDIEHKTPECIEGKGYGYVKVFLKRKLPKCQRQSLLKRFRSFLSKLSERRRPVFSPIQNANRTSS
jgi:hypothetical protein